MSDLNKMMVNVQKESKETEKRLKSLYSSYENFYKSGHSSLTHERAVMGSMDGLESFNRLILTVRRNRDIIKAMLRGFKGLHSISDFRFVEEDIKPPSIKKKKKKKKKKKVPDFQSMGYVAVPEDLNG